MPRTGFTLIEMVAVVAILAVTASLAVLAYGGVGRTTDLQGIRAECATIRAACLRFRQDTGRTPRCLAELLQDGWWWAADFAAYDQATRRGWNGPYLMAEAGTADDPRTADLDERRTEERRLTCADPAAATPVYRYETRAADPDASPAHPLLLLRSDYGGFPQNAEPDAAGKPRLRSHFQLEELAEGGGRMLYVRFVDDPVREPAADPRADPNVVVRLATGLKVAP